MTLEMVEAPPCCSVCSGPLEETGRAVPPALWCSWCGADVE